jgi:hypothetical protein
MHEVMHIVHTIFYLTLVVMLGTFLTRAAP